MRYRSFGRSSAAISTLTLNLENTQGKARAADWRNIIFAGLENGINAFELAPDANAGVLAGLNEALQSVERHLCFITLRCIVYSDDLARQTVLRAVAETAEHVGIERFDCLMLEGPGLETLDAADLQAVNELRAIARYIGMAGAPRLETLAHRGQIDAIAADYNLTSPVQDRNRIRLLSGMGVAIVIDQACPAEVLEPPAPPQRRGFFGRRVYAPSGGYDFMHATPGWTAEQICLGYALTEPGVTSIRVSATTPKRIAALAEVVDRDVPGGLSAQVEMARFAAAPPAAPAATLVRRFG